MADRFTVLHSGTRTIMRKLTGVRIIDLDTSQKNPVFWSMDEIERGNYLTWNPVDLKVENLVKLDGKEYSKVIQLHGDP